MKIALLQTAAFPMNLDVCAGVERVEIEEVTRLRDMGHETKLTVSAVISKKKMLPEWLEIIKDWGWDNRFLKWKYLLHFISANKKADVFHGHYATGLPLLAPKKSVVHFHGFAIGELPLYRYAFARKRYKEAHYIFCAKHLIETFNRRYPEIPQRHLHLLYNGIDVEKFKPANHKQENGKVKFSFHGRWVEHKGIKSLLKAVEVLEKKRDDFECLIAGSSSMAGLGNQQQQFAEEVKEMAGKLKTVKLFGAISYDKMPEFLQAMDFGVVPSVYPDPFPLAPLEIMACGLPVVAYAMGGLKEMVENGEEGILVENNDHIKLANAIEKLIESSSLRKEMGEKARRKIEKNFTWNNHIYNLLKIYENKSAVK